MIGKILLGNHCDINIAAATKAKEAPMPCKTFANEKMIILFESQVIVFPSANKKTPVLTTKRALNLSSR